jgi:hypothetical protein
MLPFDANLCRCKSVIINSRIQSTLSSHLRRDLPSCLSLEIIQPNLLIYSSPHACYKSCPPRPSSTYPSNIRRIIQIQRGLHPSPVCLHPQRPGPVFLPHLIFPVYSYTPIPSPITLPCRWRHYGLPKHCHPTTAPQRTTV